MKKILVLALTLLAGPAWAQWQTPAGTIPVGRGAGVTGFGTVGGSGGGSTKCLVDGVPPVFGTCPNPLGWFIVGSSQYPTAQSAVNAANAQNGGVVYFPCGPDVALGAGATGLNLANTKNVRLLGAQGPNSGSTTCGAIRYTGTGTMIDASGSIGLEIENLFIVGLAATKCIAFDQNANLAVYASIKRNFITCKNTVGGIALSLEYLIIATIEQNSMVAHTIVRGDAGVPGAVANVINFRGNTFHTGATYHVVNPQGIWSFDGDTFEGSQSGTSIFTSGSASTCFVLNFRGVDFDDPVAVGPANGVIETACKQVNMKDGVLAASAGQTGIVAPAGTGARINVDGTFFNLAGTVANINTGNCGQVKNYRAPAAAFIMIGTANGCGIVDFNLNFEIFKAGLQSGIAGVTTGVHDFTGAISGTARITAQATAGTPTLTLPNTSGTFAVGTTSPLVLSATTGALTCPTCATSSGGGAITGTAPITVSAAGVVSLDDAGVTFAKIQNLAALSVIGRSVNSIGVSSNISTTSGSTAVLRESGGVLGFGAISIGAIGGLGTGVGSVLATSVGVAGGPVAFNGAGGVPTSLGLDNATHPASGTTTTVAGCTGGGTVSSGSTINWIFKAYGKLVWAQATVTPTHTCATSVSMPLPVGTARTSMNQTLTGQSSNIGLSQRGFIAGGGTTAECTASGTGNPCASAQAINLNGWYEVN